MSYCTQQDLIDEFTEAELIQLTDVDNSNAINATAVNKAIARADNAINRRLAGRNLASNVTDLACDITRYFLYADAVTEIVKERYNNALKELDKIATLELSALDTNGAAADQSDLAQIQSNASIFARDAY